MVEKCFHCKKRSFILIDCKCEQSFCVKHQLPEKHKCSYVYEKHLIETIPLAKKIETI